MTRARPTSLLVYGICGSTNWSTNKVTGARRQQLVYELCWSTRTARVARARPTSLLVIQDAPVIFDTVEDYRMETDLTFGKVIIECMCKDWDAGQCPKSSRRCKNIPLKQAFFQPC